METVSDFILGGSKVTADGDCSHEIKRHLLLGRKTMTNPDSILKTNKGTFQNARWKAEERRLPELRTATHSFPLPPPPKKIKTNKGPSSQSYGFSSGHAWMWELDYKESWAPKNRCFWTVVLEKTLESSLDCKEIKPINPKGNQPWIFIWRTDAEAEAPILWPPDAMNWLTGKDPDAGKDRRREEKGTTEDEMVGWHHCLNGHE